MFGFPEMAKEKVSAKIMVSEIKEITRWERIRLEWKPDYYP